MVLLYSDFAFREKWVAKKKTVLKTDEAGLIDLRPPALQRVEYRFWKVEDDEQSDDYELDSEDGTSDLIDSEDEELPDFQGESAL